jgi:hypothetical protein
VYSKTEQFVPFTKRRHNVLLPSVAGMYGNVAALHTVHVPDSLAKRVYTSQSDLKPATKLVTQ